MGLLGLVSGWEHRTRFWLPAALVWMGSGGLAAFDALTLMLNRLLLIIGRDAAESAWGLADTALVIKVVLGVLAAAVGARWRPRPPRRLTEADQQLRRDERPSQVLPYTNQGPRRAQRARVSPRAACEISRCP